MRLWASRPLVRWIMVAAKPESSGAAGSSRRRLAGPNGGSWCLAPLPGLANCSATTCLERPQPADTRAAKRHSTAISSSSLFVRRQETYRSEMRRGLPASRRRSYHRCGYEHHCCGQWNARVVCATSLFQKQRIVQELLFSKGQAAVQLRSMAPDAPSFSDSGVIPPAMFDWHGVPLSRRRVDELRYVA
jgi:hypothetical protein